MKNTKARVRSFTRAALLLPRAAAIVVVALGLLSLGCPGDTTPVQTSVGIRPAGEVKTIDQVADVLANLRDAQNAAVKAHDAKVGLEDTKVHADRSKLLTDTGAALKTSILILAKIKRGEVSSGPTAALVPILALAPSLLDLAVDLGVMPKKTADTIRIFLGPALPSGTSWRLIRTGAGTYVELVRVNRAGVVVARRLT